MKAYGFKTEDSLVCCPGHSPCVVKSKHSHRTRQDRDATRRRFKKTARRVARFEALKESYEPAS